MNEFKIIEEKENLLFNRKEVRGSAESEITPSRAETLEVLSKKFNVPIENIKIKKITGKFGSKTFDIVANIYSSEQDKDNIELKKKKEKVSKQKPKEVAEVAGEPPKEIQKEQIEEKSQKEETKSEEKPEQ